MLIGISGCAGAGKDTVADALVREHGYIKIALADPMKRAVAEWFGWGAQQLWGPSELRNVPDPRLGLTPRHALQQLGTEFGRACYRDVWVDYAMRVARDLQMGGMGYAPADGTYPNPARTRPPAGVVISDVRFRNEIDAIKRVGGKVVRVVRPRAGLDGQSSLHASEKEQSGIPDGDFDHVVQNDGDLGALYARVRESLNAIAARGST